MKLIFNDATEIVVQQVNPRGDSLQILVVGITPEQLKVLFMDTSRTARMTVQERGQTIVTYEGYTEYDHTEIYPGGIYGVVNNQVGKTTEERLSGMERDIKDLQDGGVAPENYSAVFTLAKMQAQAIADNGATKVKSLYDTFDELVEREFTAEKRGYKFRDGDNLYKTAQDNVKFEAHFRPGSGTESLYTKIDETHAGTIKDPIPAVANMEYEYGKHYIEDDVIYICKRGGVPNPEEMYGQKVTLQYPPSQLIGQYFEVVE